MQHFKDHHSHDSDGRCIVPLPKKPHVKPFGESRLQAVRRHSCLVRSLQSRGAYNKFHLAMEEYFENNHAELVSTNDLEKPASEVFYLPMRSVYKETSTTTKERAVFDVSAPSSFGVSLNDLLLVCPTIHSFLVDVLIHFRLHRIGLTTDVGHMYRMVLLEAPTRISIGLSGGETQPNPCATTALCESLLVSLPHPTLPTWL